MIPLSEVYASRRTGIITVALGIVLLVDYHLPIRTSWAMGILLVVSGAVQCVEYVQHQRLRRRLARDLVAATEQIAKTEMQRFLSVLLDWTWMGRAPADGAHGERRGH